MYRYIIYIFLIYEARCPLKRWISEEFTLASSYSIIRKQFFGLFFISSKIHKNTHSENQKIVNFDSLSFENCLYA